MKKSEQLKINNEVLRALYELYSHKESVINKVRINKCKAYIVETENYYLLFSYNTLVAFINKHYQICYDILRLVYGYTNASAQHIAKFRNAYGYASASAHHITKFHNAYGAVDTLTYKPVKGVSHD